ncbi:MULTISPECIES: elongation factor G [unclassified Synechocystis]|uniref:elongation factor G n=1 Tax=unclassified Synechocystis TaxID=2640012 RepID=UPI0004140D4D|nr:MULTISPECIES: elongation factor G [unclassified Synechocystis]AIE76031.1 Translation elongation factor G-related protein [Synechocystis sp. PCC 6714]MCT0255063.1 elongation factor G [Synechocystis sp. CS-94]
MNNPSNESLRNVAIVGPYGSGKTTLLESILWVSGSITRKGSIKDGNTVSDSSPEAKARQMSVEVSIAGIDYEGLRLNFLDCPGSIEFAQETYGALIGAGTAVIVCEADVSRVMTLAPLLKFLDDWTIPHLVFINKMERAKQPFGEVLQALKTVSSRPLIPQQYPIYQGEELRGYIDLITEQAYQYHNGSAADPIALPPELAGAEHKARQEMLEALADFDDRLLEELMEEVEPAQAEIEADFKQELGADLIVPVVIGVAEQDFGVRPLLDVLIKEASDPSVTADRRGLSTDGSGPVIAQVLKTYFTPQGRLSLARIWQGTLQDSDSLNGQRLGGIYRLFGGQQTPVQTATVGEIVGLARLENVRTGTTLSTVEVEPLPFVDPLPPLYGLAIAPEQRKDEVKLSAALAKLVEEDPSLTWEQNSETQEVILWGQGEIHLKVALERLQRQYKLPMVSQQPQVPYKETIRKATEIHGRYKHQTGGHGAFGDVYLTIKPLERGVGFSFSETIVGGVVPKQYIPGVEMGVREYLEKGPLGYPVVDLAVTLTDGSYHNVDSSEQAFKQAARLGMAEGMPQCNPVLLEPILSVNVTTPTEFTSRVLQLVSGHRGQILGYEGRSDWKSWDQVTAHLPQAEMQNFIIELRSLTLGVGTFTWQYDHLQEVPDRFMPNH